MNKHSSGETVRAEHLKIVLGLGSVWMASGTDSGSGAMGKDNHCSTCMYLVQFVLNIVGRKKGFRFPRLLGHPCDVEYGSTSVYLFSVSKWQKK